MTLLLAEELVLLCMDDETGHCEVAPGTMRRGVALALVFELSLQGVLAVENGKFTQRGEPLADEVLRLAAEGAAGATPTSAVRRLADDDPLTAMLARLVTRGVLHDAEVWSPGVHLPKEPHREAAVRDRLHAVLVAGGEPSEHDTALIALLHHLGIVTRVLPSSEPKELTTRAEEIATQSRPLQDYEGRQTSSKSRRWWDATDVLDVVVHALNIFN